MRKITFTVQMNPKTYDGPTDDMVREDLENQPAMHGFTGEGAILNLNRFTHDDRKHRWVASTLWPNDWRLSKHKLADPTKHDPDYNLLQSGAHRPVLCFFGDSHSDKRSVVGKKLRNRIKSGNYKWRHGRWYSSRDKKKSTTVNCLMRHQPEVGRGRGRPTFCARQ